MPVNSTSRTTSAPLSRERLHLASLPRREGQTFPVESKTFGFYAWCAINMPGQPGAYDHLTICTPPLERRLGLRTTLSENHACVLRAPGADPRITLLRRIDLGDAPMLVGCDEAAQRRF
jgi:hypothetical protein